MKSEKLDLLASALSKAQAEMPAVPMNAVNPFLKNKYADLAEMIRVASPILSKHGLSISQQPISIDSHVGVTTTLLHASGQWIEDTILLPLCDEKGKSLAQVAGSIITYLRRYSYGAIVGLATDEDTDGNAPVKRHEQPAVHYTTGEIVEDVPAVPLDNIPDMSLELAMSEKTSKGDLYGDLPNDKLAFMFNAISKKVPHTDDHKRKMVAIQTILESRASGSGA